MDCSLYQNGVELWNGLMTVYELFAFTGKHSMVSTGFSLDYFHFQMPNDINTSIMCFKG